MTREVRRIVRDGFQEAASPLRQQYTDNYGSQWLDLLQASIDKCVSEIDAEYANLN